MQLSVGLDTQIQCLFLRFLSSFLANSTHLLSSNINSSLKLLNPSLLEL